MPPRDDVFARRLRRTAMLVAWPVLIGGIALAGAPANAAPAPAPAVPTFQDGLSQAVFTTTASQWIRQELWVEAEVDSDRDGRNDLVHIDITRVPETDGAGLKVPVIMEMSPYYAGGSSVGNWSVDHELGAPPTTKPGFPPPNTRQTSPKISTTFESTWVPRGFAVVHAESLGSGWSEGCPTSGGLNESLGGKAVVDWLNGRATAYTSTDRTTAVSANWATGSVGMIGTSYNGTLPIGVASTGVPGLDAIVPISAISDWYNYYRANGAVRAPGGYQGEDLDVLADYVHTRRDQPTCQPIIDELRANQDRATGDRSEFWAERDYLANADKITAATLVAHGQNDWNVMAKNAADVYEAVKANGTPHQIYLHQGGHGGAPNDTLLNRWFTRYLYKVENGVESLPKAYVVREDNVLTEYPEWPQPGTAPVALKLNSAGTAGGIGGLDFGTDTSGRTESFVDDAQQRATNLAAAAESENRLAYRTRQLTGPVRLSGTPKVSLDLAVDREQANLTALLVSYPASGAPKIVSRGWMDVQNRNSDAVTDPIEPGTSYRFDFAFEPKDYVFPAGSQIGLVVMSSDYEYTIRPAAGTRLTLAPASSNLQLPIVGGAGELVANLAAGGPGAGFQVITTEVTGGALSMAVSSGDPVVLDPITLTGVDQSTAGSLHAVRVVDSRGSAAGWDLTGQVSDFTSGSGVILAENLGWSPDASVESGGLPTAEEEAPAVSPGTAVSPGAGLRAPLTLCASAKGSSAGAFACSGDLELGVPGSTRSGTYTGVLTLTLI